MIYGKIYVLNTENPKINMNTGNILLIVFCVLATLVTYSSRYAQSLLDKMSVCHSSVVYSSVQRPVMFLSITMYFYYQLFLCKHKNYNKSVSL